MSQDSRRRHVHSYLRDNGMLFTSDRRFTTRSEPVRFLDDVFTPDALEEGVDEPEAQYVISEVMSERCPCVRRADLGQFEIHVLLPLNTDGAEKVRLWKMYNEYFESQEYDVIAQDLRAKKLAVAS